MKPVVLVTKRIPKEIEAYLSQHCSLKVWDKKEAISREQLLAEIADVEGLLTTNNCIIDRELLERAPRLKVVSNIAVGYNSYDLEAMKEKRVLGTHTPFVLDETVADLAFALILAAARRIPEMDKFVKDGKWVKSVGEDGFGVDVHHATLGILGLGRIGAKIAKRAKFGFSMDVLYYDRHRNIEQEKELGVQYSEFYKLLERSDFVLVMLPLTEETTGLIGDNEFDVMKREAIFINCSRGPIVDEAALIRALLEKKIRGAALDVYEKEPVNPDNPLLRMENVVTVPHLGSATAKTRSDMLRVAAENLVAGIKGETPAYLVKELKELAVNQPS